MICIQNLVHVSGFHLEQEELNRQLMSRFLLLSHLKGRTVNKIQEVGRGRACIVWRPVL